MNTRTVRYDVFQLDASGKPVAKPAATFFESEAAQQIVSDSWKSVAHVEAERAAEGLAIRNPGKRYVVKTTTEFFSREYVSKPTSTRSAVGAR